MALFRDPNVGRRWAVEHFPGCHRLEGLEMYSSEELKAGVTAAIAEWSKGLSQNEPEAARKEAVQPAPSLSPEVVLPPAPSAGLPQTKEELAEAGEPHTSINWSGDPDLRDHDEAVKPKSVKRRSKKMEQ